MSITKNKNVTYTNGYGYSFCSEEEALADEKRRYSHEWRVAKILGIYYEHQRAKGVTAIDDTKAPFTGQPHGTCTVYLFKDLVENMQNLLAKHGELSGFTTHHCGMGKDVSEMVLIERNPNEGQPPIE